ncbi:MAG: hypothetical protein LBJ07_01960 [Actinomycetes bacterium]|jgi:hypothetical protein|nr:hypothetical protein [Actinomycetes bacterium]
MAQISLYVDDATLARISREANSEQVSVSKYVAAALDMHLRKGWSARMRNLFGALRDSVGSNRDVGSDFRRPEQSSFDDDVRRQTL